MNETRQRKGSANQENQLIHFLVCYRLCWYQLGRQATTRGMVGTNYPHRFNRYRNDSLSSETLERLELSQ